MPFRNSKQLIPNSEKENSEIGIWLFEIFFCSPDRLVFQNQVEKEWRPKYGDQALWGERPAETREGSVRILGYHYAMDS